MQIETYEIQLAPSEASGLAMEGASLELIEKLGLVGQKNISKDGNINPFRAMEQREMVVYGALCPEKCDIKKYAVDNIPLRILEIADRAMNTGLYARIEVWYPKEARIDDPVLVGVVQQKHEYSGGGTWTTDKLYLLARWGKMLPSFEQCEAMALDMLKKKTMSYINKVLVKAKMAKDILMESTDIMDFSKEQDFSIWKLTNE
jgi:hypothetical protein